MKKLLMMMSFLALTVGAMAQCDKSCDKIWQKCYS